MDISDLNFKPCPCGYQVRFPSHPCYASCSCSVLYQVCQFCWHHIKENLNSRCPACRREYTDEAVQFKPINPEECVIHSSSLSPSSSVSMLHVQAPPMTNVGVSLNPCTSALDRQSIWAATPTRPLLVSILRAMYLHPSRPVLQLNEFPEVALKHPIRASVFASSWY